MTPLQKQDDNDVENGSLLQVRGASGPREMSRQVVRVGYMKYASTCKSGDRKKCASGHKSVDREKCASGR